MDFIKSIIHGAIDIGMFFTFGLPVIVMGIGLIVVAIKLFIFCFEEGNIFSFIGRTNRKSFVINFLLILLIGMLPAVIFCVLAVKFKSIILLILTIFFVLCAVIAHYANLARRFHDFGQSAWWTLLIFAMGFFFNYEGSPFSLFCNLLFIVFALIPGTKGSNKYGADPLETNADS